MLTDQGRRFLPHALVFLERAQELCRACEVEAGAQEIRVASSQYLTRYLLIDVLKDFRRAAPEIHVRISRDELESKKSPRHDPEVAMGVAAPYEPSPDFDYHELFAMSWRLITPPRHPLSLKRRTRLQDLAAQPLIIYERGSTGRQHVLDAFHETGVSPHVTLETTSTETIVSMVDSESVSRSCRFCQAAPSHAAVVSKRAGSTHRFDPSTPACLSGGARGSLPRHRGCSISSSCIFHGRRGSVTALD